MELPLDQNGFYVFRVDSVNASLSEVTTWLAERLPQINRGERWTNSVFGDRSDHQVFYYFRDPKDAMLFKLTWVCSPLGYEL